jgi:hypothetical protein
MTLGLSDLSRTTQQILFVASETLYALRASTECGVETAPDHQPVP